MAGDAHRKLPPEAFKTALARIAEWQGGADVPVACPACGAEGLVITDRSARPYTAWFTLECRACRLDDTITYPLGGAGGSWS